MIEQIREIAKQYPESKSAILPALRLAQEQYGWLMHPAIIVVDEAHRSISPRYTRALSALDGGGEAG